jgi:hypothetical protein
LPLETGFSRLDRSLEASLLKFFSAFSFFLRRFHFLASSFSCQSLFSALIILWAIVDDNFNKAKAFLELLQMPEWRIVCSLWMPSWAARNGLQGVI